MKQGIARIGRALLAVPRVAFGVVASLVLLGLRAVRGVAGLALVRSGFRVVAASAALAALVLGIGAACLVRIPPGMIGVEQVEFGGAGIAARDQKPGIVFSWPFVASWHLLEGRTLVLSFGWESEGGEFPILDLRTREGTPVKVGAAVVHRIRPGEAWQLVRDGLKGAWKRRVRAAAESALARKVARMSTAELCDTRERGEAAAEVGRELRDLLAADHVEVEAVLLTQVWFGPTYEKKLQARQLAAQQVLLQAAAMDVDAQRARIEILGIEIENSSKAVVAEWNQTIEERSAAGRGEIAAVQAATKAYDRQRRAEAQVERDRQILAGDRSLARAESLRESLMQKALATGGGRIWLARQAAENLNIKGVTLNSNDPSVPSVLDLDRMERLLLGSEASRP